jgi:hypothetical protein
MKHPRPLGTALALVALLVVGALASSASAQSNDATRTPTELGQSVPTAQFNTDLATRTSTEVGQSVPTAQFNRDLATRTSTEVGQSVPTGDSGTVAMRRDASQAVPFLASVGPTTTSASSDGFDWGDAAIGAASMLGLVAVGLGGLALLIRRRRPDRVPVATT